MTSIRHCRNGIDCFHADGPDLPATTEYFYAQPGLRDGLKSLCKACTKEQVREYAAKNREVIRARAKARRQTPEAKARRKSYLENYTPPPASVERTRTRMQLYRQRPEVKERQRLRQQTPHAKALKRAHRQINRHLYRKWGLAYYHRNKDMNQEYRQAYRQRPEVKARTRQMQQRSQYKAQKRLRSRLYRASQQGKALASIHRHNRRARLRSNRSDFTRGQWLRCLEHFDWCCAYCDLPLTGPEPAEMDHIVPLSAPQCPGTTAINIVPACHSCNSSKGARELHKWLAWKFIERAPFIYRRIQCYLNSLDAPIRVPAQE